MREIKHPFLKKGRGRFMNSYLISNYTNFRFGYE